jgi:hypothetical protein
MVFGSPDILNDFLEIIWVDEELRGDVGIGGQRRSCGSLCAICKCLFVGGSSLIWIGVGLGV